MFDRDIRGLERDRSRSGRDMISGVFKTSATATIEMFQEDKYFVDFDRKTKFYKLLGFPLIDVSGGFASICFKTLK